MNKNEKIICFLLGLALVWCFMSGTGKQQQEERKPAETETAAVADAEKPAEGAPATVASVASTNAVPDAVEAPAQPSVEPPAEAVKPVERLPETVYVLENDELRLELSSHGAVVTSAVLKKYATGLGEISEDNPALVFDYGRMPLGMLLVPAGKGGLDTDYLVTASNGAESVTFTAGGLSRTYTLGKDYSLVLDETYDEGARLPAETAVGLSMGVMSRGAGANDLLSIDHCAKDGTVVHHDDEKTPFRRLLTGSESGGCGCGSVQVSSGMPESDGASVETPLAWAALKNRFFVTACVKTSQPAKGLRSVVWRDMDSSHYLAKDAAACVVFDGGVEKRTTEFFIGPKKQSMMSDRQMRDVMEFGMWRWVCYPIVWLLNLCYGLIPSYGVAIILLTILVRLVFWPLTRKSTEGMKKMQEIQPLLKELQAKYKGNPQRLQQETFALYREKKVNPLSSCLPMLIQIPVFIALFNVLRASVELRYAGFLWIADLSEPEHLFASWFPFGGLNILPILMAATMYLQSKLTPTAGDPNQQRMMSVMMPALMLFMFYNFASALSLYWTLSQVMSIVQMWMIRRKSEQRKAKAFEPEIIDPPTPTRQQRRHT